MPLISTLGHTSAKKSGVLGSPRFQGINITGGVNLATKVNDIFIDKNKSIYIFYTRSGNETGIVKIDKFGSVKYFYTLSTTSSSDYLKLAANNSFNMFYPASGATVEFLMLNLETPNLPLQLTRSSISQTPRGKVDSSSNIYVSYNLTGGILEKFDSSGVFQWGLDIVETTATEVNQVTIDNDNNIYWYGTKTDSTFVIPVLLKINSSGDIIFQKTNTAVSENAASIHEINIFPQTNNILIPWTRGASNFGITKQNSSGNELWSKTITSSLGSFITPSLSSIKIDEDENIYVSTRLSSNLTINYVFCMDKDGTILWQKKISDASFNGSFSMGVDSDTVYVASSKISTGNLNILKLDKKSGEPFSSTYSVGSNTYSFSNTTEISTSSTNTIFATDSNFTTQASPSGVWSVTTTRTLTSTSDTLKIYQ